MCNEELILLLAEANIGFDNGAALEAINTVRTGNGIDAVSLSTDEELVDELLAQRRLSLFYEGIVGWTCAGTTGCQSFLWIGQEMMYGYKCPDLFLKRFNSSYNWAHLVRWAQLFLLSGRLDTMR